MAEQILSGEGETTSRLLRKGDADPDHAPVIIGSRYPVKPQGRPVHAELTTGHPDKPELNRSAWDDKQKRERKIEVLVISTPMEGFANYFCAKRCWPRGSTRTVVSPDELAELQQEVGRIQVVMASDLGHMIQVPAALVSSEQKVEIAKATTPEVAAMPDIAPQATAPKKR